MTIGRTRTSIVAAALMVSLLPALPARADVLAKVQIKCSKAIAKAGLGFVKGKLKLLQKCHNANLKDGSCAAPDGAAVTKLEDKLIATIDKDCAPLSSFALTNMGFPGPCGDNTPATFTAGELEACIKSSHEQIIDQMIALEYDSSLSAPYGGDPLDLKCQSEVAKQSGGLVQCIMKNVAKCRGDLQAGKPLGVPPDLCATNYDKAANAIAKCRTKLTEGIGKKCTSPQITALKICTPDQTDAAGAATCLINEHTNRTDSPEIAAPADLIDFEFASRGGVCGDNIVNQLNEECDGTDDSACPGQCGAPLLPDGNFACLCKTKPRMFVVEHANADTDNGWKGVSFDGHVVEGGGYLVDLYDCDGGGLCIAGPSCSLAPHAPCAVAENAPAGTTSDSICAGLSQGVCRKERTANGPHCHVDIQKKCNFAATNPNAPCTGINDFCETTFHGPPVAQSSGGTSVCAVNRFSQDVTGTVNINDGTSAVRARQRAQTFLGIQANKPCPVCGGFCGVSREPCTTSADCDAGESCITAPICSDGPRQDKPCRASAPFGGFNTFFGITSIDCPPPTSLTEITQDGGIDVDANPRTTGTVTLLPTVSCSGTGFTNNTCRGGTNEGRACVVNSECPGGTCSPQCFCAGQTQPNNCNDACVGGANDAAQCDVDSECPGGFCHRGDCRVDPSDTDSNQEGICTAGPPVGHCSTTVVRGCTSDSDCLPANCSFCGSGETCVTKDIPCFVNSSITRSGTPRTPDGESAAVYCVPANNTAINQTAGFPAPGALIQRETVHVVP
jgi:hypothetical protein